jgi:transcriptional regulator with XRE-family HTH domain
VSSAKPPGKQRDSPDLKALGRRLRELRGFELTQEKFANELGVSQSQLSKFERGVVAPPAEVLFFVKKRFGVSLDWLLTGEGERS